MVEYSKWVSIAFEEARSQGFNSTFETNGEVVSLAADIWNDRKDELMNASVQSARSIAEEEISVT